MPEDRCSTVTGVITGACTSETVSIQAITTGATARIHAGLAKLTVQINMDSIITLPEPALEIKNIKKRVKVTQCKLLQPTNTLFIKGFVRKDINYATRQCSNLDGVCGDIRHCTVDAPFRCTTSVIYNGVNPANIAFDTNRNFNQFSTQIFNELPNCELVSARIVEYDEYLNRTNIPEAVPLERGEFIKVQEETILLLTLKILQNRNVSIAPVSLFARPQ